MIWLSQLLVSVMNILAPLYGNARIKDVSTEEVARLLEDDARDCVLVDARSDSEMGVSVIPGAISREEFLARNDGLEKDLVIAYCTVGGRSLLFAQQCAKRGFEVRNYRGSILAWCSAGKPLITPDGSPTTKIHTHNRLFSAPTAYERVL